MSGKISSQLAYSGVSLYALIRDSQTGLIANGSSLTTYNVSNYATYIVAMTEQVPTGYFTADFPSYLPAGIYSYSVHQGTGVAGDLSVDRGIMDWSGTAENYVGLLPTQIKTEVDISLDTDVIPELSAVPSATPTLKTALMFLFMALRNKRTNTATAMNIYNASGTSITQATQSDNGTVYDKSNFT
jgi:hypothetical protein